MTVEINDIERIIAEQNTWRQTKTINLIASENTPSEAVQRVQISDFMGRYAEGHPNQGDKTNRYYQGTRFIDEIERMATAEILELFNARQADVRPISGNAANTAIALGWLRGGDTIIANSTDRSEEHTSELQSPAMISYAVFCLKKKTQQTQVDILAMALLVSLAGVFKCEVNRSR